MIKNGDANPLNIFGLRELSHCPPHFERVIFTLKTSKGEIKNWLYENLDGRFWMGDFCQPTENNKWSLDFCVGFEEHSEASFFSLFLDTINVSK